jgi:ankyrin repeat protein
LSAYTSDKGASIEAKDQNGYTALLIIARREHAMGEQNKAPTALIKLLLERGANMEARDLNGSYRLGSVG